MWTLATTPLRNSATVVLVGTLLHLFTERPAIRGQRFSPSMIHRIDYRHSGTRYVFVDAQTFRRSRAPGDEALEHASRLEARWVLEAIARRESSLLDRLCRALDGGGVMAQRCARRPLDLGDPRVEQVLRACGLAREAATRGEAPVGARVYLLRETTDRRPSGAPDSPEAQAIDRAIAQLGPEALVFRGSHYRVARAAGLAGVPRRELFDTLSEAELLVVLRAWSAEPACPAALKGAFTQLLDLAEAQRAKRGHTELVLLRRRPLYARILPEDPALTPAQLKAARQPHWIEIEALDQDGLPVAGVALEVVLASGGTTQLATDERGLARLDDLQGGTLTVRVLSLDQSAWRPRSGAAASASSRQHAALAHKVAPGECIAKIAHRYGVKDWRDVWNDKANAALRKRRKDPHVLHPGDTLVVAPRVYEIARATDARHTLEVARAEQRVRVWLRTLGDGVLKNVEYDYSYVLGDRTIEKPGAAPTNEQGMLEEQLPITVRTFHVTLRSMGLRLRYDVSSLEPARDDDTQAPLARGIRQRLHALGYSVAPTERGSLVAAGPALALFQQLSLKRTSAQGDPDAETLGALERRHTA